MSGLVRSLPLLLVLASGCQETRCEDLEPAPVSGTYKGGGSLGGVRLLNVGLVAKGKDVELSFTAKDGSRIRAKYKVSKKLKKKP